MGYNARRVLERGGEGVSGRIIGESPREATPRRGPNAGARAGTVRIGPGIWIEGAVSLTAVLLGGCSSASNEPAPAPRPVPPPSLGMTDGTTDTPPPPSTLGTGPEECTDGHAGDFPCSGISLAARVALETMGGEGAAGNDLWGWTDPQTSSEYALMGLSNGTAFVDVTDPVNPVFLGRLPTHTTDSLWRDVKVYRDHAYVVADGAGAHGMQVFDLSRLRSVPGPETWVADMHYGDFGHAHNLAIDEASGFAYAVSTDTCVGGLHIVNLATPNNPLFAGCHNVTRTHDTQCVVYEGPDTEHRGRQICVSSNEDRVEVVDVTEKSAPLNLSSVTYPQLRYVHQGWLTEDHRFFLLGDELDEIELNLTTRTHVFDVSDLDAPEYLYAHDLGTSATDHNLYVQGERVFEANYTSGLRVLRFGDLVSRDMVEMAFFDTYPDSGGPGTEGAWSVYPYLPSGTILVSDIASGLFVLTMP